MRTFLAEPLRKSLPALVRAVCFGAAATLVTASCSTKATDGAAYPTAAVRLDTDALGITHVYAQNDADAFYGAGYAMARDRLFQMEVYRRRALGTSSELFGASTMKADLGARAFNFKVLGEQDQRRVRAERPGDALLVDAWVAGVNARVDEVRSGAAPVPFGMGPAELHFMPERWDVAQPYAIGKLLAFGVSNSLDSEILATAIMRLAPDFAKRLPLTMPAFDTFTMGDAAPKGQAAPRPRVPGDPKARSASSLGPLHFIMAGSDSNNWAIDAAHSADGRPIVSGDPHQALTSPSRFWPVHISSVEGGGAFDVIGFAFPGTPAVELGHNGHIGWSVTTNFADVMDIWDVETNAERTTVRLGGGDHSIVTRSENIRVRNDAGSLDDNPTNLEDVPGVGILLPESILPLPRGLLADGNAILFNWTGFSPTREVAAYLAADRAQSVDELDAAVDLLDVGAVNFVSADKDHIDYHVHANVPDRGVPSSHPMPWHLLQGTDAASVWSGAMLGPDKLPHLRDPARGYIITANNDPWGFTADGDVENDPFYYGAFYANGLRAHRIEDALRGLLANGAKVSRADMATLQNDTHSPMADAVVPLVDAAVLAAATDPKLAAYKGRVDLQALAAALHAWDRNFARDRGEPLVFLALEWFAAKRAFYAAVPSAIFDAVASKSPPFLLGALRNVLTNRFATASSFLPSGGASELLLAALDDTAAWLTQRFGTISPSAFKYGDVNTAAFAGAYGPLDVAPVGVDGSSDTIKVCETAFFDQGAPAALMKANEASLYRMVIGFGVDGVPEATLDFARGSREDPSDPHFGDQQDSWVKGDHVPLPFRRADVQAVETRTLPAKR